MDLMEEVGSLSLVARSLQYEVHESAGASRAELRLLRTQIAGERPKLQTLVDSMATVAPQLRICAPEEADCDCAPDPTLMRTAALQVDAVRASLSSLDVALAAGPRGFDSLDQPGAQYPGGRAERALEDLNEACDLFLDLASGRPPMTARLAPLSSPRAPSLLPPPIRAVVAPRVAA